MAVRVAAPPRCFVLTAVRRCADVQSGCTSGIIRPRCLCVDSEVMSITDTIDDLRAKWNVEILTAIICGHTKIEDMLSAV